MKLEKKGGQKNPDEPVVNVTFQLVGEDAVDFLEYMRREIISINSVAGRKLALERLREVQKEWGPAETVAA